MSFVYPHVNIIAILAAAVAQFVLGFIWYSPMTPIGATWMREMKIPGDSKPGAEMLAFPVGAIMAAWAVAMVYGWSGAHGAYQGMLAGWVVAMAVGAQVLTASVANSMRTPVLLAINLGFVVVSYALMGVLVGLLA